MPLTRSRFELQRNARLGGISVHCDPGFHARGIQTRIEEFLEIETYRANTHFAIYVNDQIGQSDLVCPGVLDN